MTATMNQQLSELLAETIVKFCRKHNYFDQELQVQGTICITSDVTSFLVTQISDKFRSPLATTTSTSGPVYRVYGSPQDFTVTPVSTNSYLEEGLEEPPSPGYDAVDATNLGPYTCQSNYKPRPHKRSRGRSNNSSSLGQIEFVKIPAPRKRNKTAINQQIQVVKEEAESGEEEGEEEGKSGRRSVTPDPERSQSSESFPSVKSEQGLMEESNEDLENVSTSLESEYLTPQFASFGSQNMNLTAMQTRNAASSFVQKRPDGKYGCALCDVEYSNRGTLQRHIDGRHLGRNYTCVICHVTFESHSGWSRHLRTKHSQHMPLSCEICGKKFKFSMALEQHKRRLHAAEIKVTQDNSVLLGQDSPDPKQ